MSAFVVDDFHINFLVNWASNPYHSGAVSYFWGGDWHDIRRDPARVAHVLHAENVRSVNYRYRENQSADNFQFVHMGMGYLDPDAVQVIKAAHCLRYQSCETPDYFETEAHAILAAMIDAATRELPGYADAHWALNAEVFA